MTTLPERLSVLIADDDARVRTALTGLLAEEPDFEVVAQTTDGVQAVAAARETEARLVIADVRMPHGGPDLVRRLAALPHRPVIVGLSAQSDSTTWQRMLTAGCSAYLVKGTVGSDLAPLLRRSARGELVIGVAGAAEVFRRLLLR